MTVGEGWGWLVISESLSHSSQGRHSKQISLWWNCTKRTVHVSVEQESESMTGTQGRGNLQQTVLPLARPHHLKIWYSLKTVPSSFRTWRLGTRFHLFPFHNLPTLLQMKSLLFKEQLHKTWIFVCFCSTGISFVHHWLIREPCSVKIAGSEDNWQWH